MPEPTAVVQENATAPVPRLRRVLTVWDLTFYGLLLIQPTAPVPVFGVVQNLSRGHIVDTILISMLAMVITAFSYGRMAAIYPSADSAYTYVSRSLNPHLGFVAGWAMLLENLLQPLQNSIWVAAALHRVIPLLPFAIASALFIGAITLLNLRGIRTTARANQILLTCMFIVIGAFLALAVRYIFHAEGWGGFVSSRPFYNPQTFEVHSIRMATSVATVTYIGFDGVTTLAEDVENPKRNVLLATVMVCLFTGIFAGLLVYLGQLIWPDYRAFPNLETAFIDVSRRVGGAMLFHAMAWVLILAGVGAALTGAVAAARQLFGMGRDNVLPRRVFAYLDPKRNNPTLNIWIIGVLALAGSLIVSYEWATELLNFGAFVAFMGVNLAALRQFYFIGQTGRKRRLWADAILPLIGFLFCFWICWGLPLSAKVIGGIWLAAGLTYAHFKTRGFRNQARIDFSET